MPFRWRSDGTYADDVPNVRRIMPYLMPRRNESVVYMQQRIEAAAADRFLAAFRDRTGLRATYLHLLVWASVRAIEARPRLNRFVAGRRIFQRDGIYISFSGKKAKRDDKPLVTVKRRFDPGWDFEQIVRHIEGDIVDARSDKESAVDKELKWFLKLPAWILGPLVRLQMWADAHGLLPHSFIESDPLYTSLFIANLGSIELEAGYHHLFEYGNCPIFMAVGKAREEVLPDPDAPTGIAVKKIIPIKYTFDERIEDGLYCTKALDLLRQRLEAPQDYIELPSKGA